MKGLWREVKYKALLTNNYQTVCDLRYGLKRYLNFSLFLGGIGIDSRQLSKREIPVAAADN